MVEKVEDAEEVIVGNFYLVRCGKSLPGAVSVGLPAWVPILGEQHVDAEIGTGYPHWHFDWRFIKSRNFSRLSYGGRRNPIGQLITLATITGPQQFEYRRLRCARPHLQFPRAALQKLHVLEESLAKASARCGVCPHRGISLKGAPVVNGARVCPGHGLAWDVQTGALRASPAGSLTKFTVPIQKA